MILSLAIKLFNHKTFKVGSKQRNELNLQVEVTLTHILRLGILEKKSFHFI